MISRIFPLARKQEAKRKMIRSAIRNTRRTLLLALDPLRMRQAILKRSESAPLKEKIEFDALERPHFAYGVHRAAAQAKALGINHISVIEFGCAGGNGLIALESIAALVTADLGVKIDIYGFDVGEGLPKPIDYRDLPYAWKTGQFKMDIPKLEARLTTAKLVIGNVSDTVVPFLSRPDVAPIGFISFDLDFYSSTVDALKIFNGPHEKILPRAYCYFDDAIGPDNELHSEFAGELLAIKEFNESSSSSKLALIHGLGHKRTFHAVWNDVMYIMHAFEHPLYNQYIDTGIDMKLALNPA